MNIIAQTLSLNTAYMNIMLYNGPGRLLFLWPMKDFYSDKFDFERRFSFWNSRSRWNDVKRKRWRKLSDKSEGKRKEERETKKSTHSGSDFRHSIISVKMSDLLLMCEWVCMYVWLQFILFDHS